MAPTESASDILEKLSKRIEKIRECGISHGIRDADIDSCLYKTFSKKEHLKFERESKSILWAVWRVTKWVCLFYLSFFVVFTLASYHPPTVSAVSNFLQPYAYPITRMARLLTLPVSKVLNLDLTGFYESECFFNNPLYRETPVTTCDMCNITKVDTMMSSMDMYNFTDLYFNTGGLALFKNAIPKEITFEDLAKVYSENKEALGERGQSTFQANDKSMKSLSDLFEKYKAGTLENKEKLQVYWESKKLPAAQVIRQMFPRPSFIPIEGEVAVEKMLLIDGALAWDYWLPIPSLGNAWYVQASGKRQLLIYPPLHCMKECPKFIIETEPKSILFYNTNVWSIDSKKVENSTDGHGGVIFIGSYT